jgi:hypothetical protein
MLKKKSKVKLSCNRRWRPIGLWDVEAPTFSIQSAHRWRWGCQPYAPAALYPPGRFLVLISVRGWVDQRFSKSMKLTIYLSATPWNYMGGGMEVQLRIFFKWRLMGANIHINAPAPSNLIQIITVRISTGTQAILTESFHYFPQSLQENARIVSQFSLQTFPSAFFPNHYSLTQSI